MRVVEENFYFDYCQLICIKIVIMFMLPPEIPIADETNGLAPPLNLRFHITEESELKLENVPVDKIVGTTVNAHLIDSNFRPKKVFINKKFRKVWKWIQNNPNNRSNNEFIFNSESIVLAKVKDDEYYIIEGLRRLVALKHSNFVHIYAQTIDYRAIYDKIVERRTMLLEHRQKHKLQNISTNSSFKPVKQKIKPTPILKGPPRK